MDLEIINRLVFHLCSYRLSRLYIFRIVMSLLISPSFEIKKFNAMFLPRSNLLVFLLFFLYFTKSKLPNKMISLSSNVNMGDIGINSADSSPAIVFMRMLSLLNYLGSRNINLLIAYFFFNNNEIPEFDELVHADTFADEDLIDTIEKGLAFNFSRF